MENTTGPTLAASAPSSTTTLPTPAPLIQDPQLKQKTYENLSEAMLETFASPIAFLEDQLKEIEQSQDKLLLSLEAEKAKIDTFANTEQIAELLNQVGPYTIRAKKLRKDFQAVSLRMYKLKERALKLQAKQKKMDQQDEDRKRKERERESRLKAQPSSDLQAKETQQVLTDAASATATTAPETVAVASPPVVDDAKEEQAKPSVQHQSTSVRRFFRGN